MTRRQNLYQARGAGCHLFAELQKARDRILIPTPALSEYMVHAEDASRIYSNDSGFKNIVGTKGPQILSFADLPDPPQDAQINWVAEMEDEDKS
jgi:hypothetical protein